MLVADIFLARPIHLAKMQDTEIWILENVKKVATPHL